jgi:hypothetical protein
LSATETPQSRTASTLSSNLNLIAIAFTSLTAGVGLLQTYYTALGQALSNSNSDIVTKVNLWFPIGQFLISFGLGVVGFVGSRIIYPRLRSLAKDKRRVVVLALGILTFVIPIIPPNAQNLATVRQLMYLLSQHWDVYWVFMGTLISLMALSELKIRYGLIAFLLANVFAFSVYGILTVTY